MKIKPYFWTTVAIITTSSIILPGRTQTINSKLNTLFQTSTITALMAGIYEGNTTFKNLKKHGNFGLGTVNQLDGEMIGIDGKFYQLKYDGVAHLIPDTMKSPFAVVTFFQPETSINLQGQLNYQQMQQALEQKLPSKNYPYAIRIKGTFPYLKVRSVAKQTAPYSSLVNVIKKQSIFEFKNIKGTLVGFRCPEYMQGVNVTGYHFHFISEDKKTGGHLLEAKFANVQAEIDMLSGVKIDLPDSDEFKKINLGDGKAVNINTGEKDK